MMLINLRRPHRSVLRSRLLLSTALIGVGALMLPQASHAKAPYLYFDNTDTGDKGTGVILEPEDGEWGIRDSNSQYWRGLNDGVWWREPGKIGPDQIGVLRKGVNGDPVTITIDNDGGFFEADAPVEVGGLRLDSGQYTFTGELIKGGLNGDTLLLENNADDADSDLTVEAGLLGKVEVAGKGHSAVVYSGDMRENGSDVSQLSIRGDALFEITGTTTGLLQNQGETVLMDDGMHMDGAMHVGSFQNESTGELRVEGAATIDGTLVNQSIGDAEGLINIGAGDRLTVSGEVKNNGKLELGGLLETPNLINNSAGTISLLDTDGGEGSTVRGGVSNYGKILVADNVSAVLTIADPDAAVEGDGDGVFLNDGADGVFELEQNSSLTINAERFQFQSASNITVGHNLILNGEIQNSGTLTYLDTEGTATINGTLVNASTDIGGTPHPGLLQFKSEVDARGNNIRNHGTMTVGSDDPLQPSAARLVNVGRINNNAGGEVGIEGGLVETRSFDNQGTVNVDLSGNNTGTVQVAESFTNRGDATLNVNGGLIDVGDVDHQGIFANAGNVFINVVDGTAGRIEGDVIRNSGLMDVTGELRARELLENRFTGVINVQSGGLVDATQLDNHGVLDIRSANNVAGTVAGDTINNKNIINVAGALNAAARLDNGVDSTITVSSGGLIDAAQFDNAGALNINSMNGVAGTVTGGTINNENIINVAGGAVDVTEISNTGTISVNVNNGDIGTIKAATSFANEDGGIVSLNGTSLEVVDAAGTRGALSNSGQFNVNLNGTNTGSVAAATVTNSGTFDIAGSLTADTQLENNRSGTINVNGGTVTTGALSNVGQFNILSDGTDVGTVAADTVANGGTFDIAGSLTADTEFGNNRNGTINVNGGTVTTGALSNVGQFNILSDGTDVGTVAADTVANGGTFDIAGRLTADTEFGNNRNGTINVNGGTVTTGALSNVGQFNILSDGTDVGTVAADTVANGGTFDIAGNLTADTELGNNRNGTINVNGGTVTTGALSNAGRFNILSVGADTGTVAADTVTNDGTFDIKGDLNADTRFTNNADGAVHINGGVLKTVALDNSGEIFVNETGGVAGTVSVETIANRNRIDVAGELAATLIDNDGAGQINVNDGQVHSDEFVNAGALNINGSDGAVTAATAFDNNGGLVNVNGGNLSVADAAGTLGSLTNSGQLHVNMAGNTAGTVTADTVMNSNIITVAGDLTAQTSFASDDTGQVTVNGGRIRTATFDNSGKLTVARDGGGTSVGTVTAGTMFANRASGEVNVNGGRLQVKDANDVLGNLNNWGVVSVNVTNGHSGIVEADRVVNRGEVNVAGAMSAETHVNNGPRSTINVEGGSLEVNAAGNAADDAGFENSGRLNVGADGKTGSVTVGTRFLNNGTGSVVISGGELAVSDAAGVQGTLTNAGKLTVRNAKDGKTGKVRAERVENNGGVNIAGNLTTTSEFINNKGDVTLSGVLDAGTGFGNIGEFTGGKYIGTVTLAGGTLSADNLTNSGAITGSGRIRGDLENLGLIDIAGGMLVGAEFANLAGGNVTFTGRAGGPGNDSINITNAGRMALDADIAGNLTNTNSLTAAGSISGYLANAGNMTVRRNEMLELTSASEEVENTGDMTVRGTIKAASQIRNSADGNLNVLGGRIDGNVRNQGAMQLAGGSTVDGNVRNGGTLTANGTITGAVVQGQNGRLTVSDSLAVGSLSNAGTVDLNGKLTSDNVIANLESGVINLDDATVQVGGPATRAAGDILLNEGTINVLSDSRLLGGLTNHNLINMTEDSRNARLTVSGQFTNTSEVRVDGADSSLTITADRIALRQGSSVELSQVTLIGDVLNSIDLLYDRETRLAGALLNDEVGSATVTAAVDGNGNAIDNSGLLDIGGTGSLTNVAHVTNRASSTVNVAEGGELAARDVVNMAGGRMTVAGTLTAGSDAGVVNHGNLDLSGTLNGRLENDAGIAMLDGAKINGDVVNRSTGTRIGSLQGTVTIAGNLDNAGTAELAGSVRDVTNRGSGTFRTIGDLTVDSLNNAGKVTIAANDRLDSGSAVSNSGRFVIAGTLGSGLNNHNGTVVLSEGTVEGDVINSDVLRGGGNIAGHLTQNKNAELRVSGALATGGLTNRGLVAVTKGNTLSSGTAAENQGRMNIGGVFDGNISNSGSYVQNGMLKGSLTTTGSARINGEITGDLHYFGADDGKDLVITDAAAIRGKLDLGANFGIGDGRQVSAGNTLVRRDVKLSLDGTLNSELTNRGTVQVGANALFNGDVTNSRHGQILADRSIEIAGAFANNGWVDLSMNEAVGDTLTVDGGISGSGKYALDINLSNMTSDKIVATGGPATGNFDIKLNYIGNPEVNEVGRSTTLIDVSEEYQASNDFTYKVRNPQTIANEKIVYSLHRDMASGDVEMISSINPGIGALFGNISLTRSLIGVVVNRPTSPFVTGLAFDATDKPCGVGSWGRATGGTAEVSGGTGDGTIKVDSTVNANYYGMQVGTDFACFDDRFAGWSMAFGGFIGVNQGDTTQPVYVVDPETGNRLGDQASSVNDTEFDQLYGGIYATATKGRFQADLQFRHEKTDFMVSNTALMEGAGDLGLDGEEFSSAGNTLSGSLSYSYPIGENGWSFVPSMGFAYTKTETDTIVTSDGARLEFEDSEAQIGFAAATVAKTFVQTEANSAVYAFATGTIYKDFADPSVSIYTDPQINNGEPERLTSDNLGTYGELSIGANYIKVLQPGPGLRPRQLSASARIDARTGDGLESVGVTGQIRLQF